MRTRVGHAYHGCAPGKQAHPRPERALELLLPLAEAHHLPLDELVGAPLIGDPRLRLTPRTRNGRLVEPTTSVRAGIATKFLRLSSRSSEKRCVVSRHPTRLHEHIVRSKPGDASSPFGPATA